MHRLNIGNALQVLQLLLFSLIFYNIGLNFTPWILLPMVLCALFTQWRLVIIAVANMIFGAFCLSEYQSIKVLFGEGPGVATQDMILIYALLYLGVAIFYYAYAHVTIRLRRTYAMAGIVILALCASLIELNSLGAPHALMTIFINGVWFNCFYLSIRNKREQLGLLDFLVCQHSFFAATYLPVPPLLSDLVRSAPKSIEGVTKAQRRGLTLLGLIAIVTFVDQKLKVLAPYSLIVRASSFPYWAPQAGLGPYQGFDFTVVESWSIAVLSYAIILLNYLPGIGVSVAVCRMTGIDIQAPIYGLLEARSMFQFFERTNHYYCQLLLNIFVTPTFKTLSWVRNRHLRLIAALFLGILLLGFTYHHLKMFTATYYLKSGYPSNLLINGIYWFLLALLTCASFMIERGTRWSRIHPFLRFPIYFLLNAVLITFVREYETGFVTLAGRLHFLAGLIGL